MEDHYLDLQPGTVIGGRYEVIKCLGTGSMGMVYACRHRELSNKVVAMKVLFAEVARDKVAFERFRNEIVAAYEVNHPNVVRAYEYFKDGELTAFTMEYVSGGDLADRINADEPITIETILSYLKQMCLGVQAIHEAGIIHRDLKAENILISENNSVKITDFGIARSGQGHKLTEYGGIVGTIEYVSPEYLENGTVDARSDIYALGVLAYEMVTDRSPFKGETVIETMTMRLRNDPEPPSKYRENCPRMLSDIVLKAMARKPEQRYQTAKEMYDDLQLVDLKNANGSSLASLSSTKNSTPGNSEKLLTNGLDKMLGLEEDSIFKSSNNVGSASQSTNSTLGKLGQGDQNGYINQEGTQKSGIFQNSLENPYPSINVSGNNPHGNVMNTSSNLVKLRYDHKTGKPYSIQVTDQSSVARLKSLSKTVSPYINQKKSSIKSILFIFFFGFIAGIIILVLAKFSFSSQADLSIKPNKSQDNTIISQVPKNKRRN